MYLLDTNICIYLIKKRYQNLNHRIEEESAFNISISAVTIGELECGIAKSLYPEKNRIALLEFLGSFEIVPYTDIDTEAFGYIRACLNKKGTPIGPYDLQIAAQCISRDLVLITNNVKEFERVPDLKIENWVSQSK